MVFGTQEQYLYTVKYLDSTTGEFHQWVVPCLRDVYNLHPVFDGITFNKLLYRCFEPDGTRQLSTARDKLPNLHVSRVIVDTSTPEQEPAEVDDADHIDQVQIVPASSDMLQALNLKDTDGMRSAMADVFTSDTIAQGVEHVAASSWRRNKRAKAKGDGDALPGVLSPAVASSA